jgi:isocitrate dehydrogenase kinase/phosphatase
MTTRQLSESRLASLGARSISDAYTALAGRFQSITQRAQSRFASREWDRMGSDAVERLALYGQIATATAGSVGQILGDRLSDKDLWAAMKATYSAYAMDRQDFELAETFFNSITRRTFATVGVDPRIEFVDTDFGTPPTAPSAPVFRSYQGGSSVRYLIDCALADAGFTGLSGAGDVAALVERHADPRIVDRIEFARSVFYRSKGAYLVGRMVAGPESSPLVIALEQGPEGARIDAVLFSEDEVSVLFSFAHSYFHVESDRPYDLVRFINELVPRKRLSELYISLGHARHGKTEMFRELRKHLAETDEVFVAPPGKTGLVMTVFTLPGFEMVFKVIKDSFPPQKLMTPRQVMGKYRLVFHHDRAGRLVDSQSFEHLQVRADRFETGLLEGLLNECSRSVRRNGGLVEIDLAYAQRRVDPLDVFIACADSEEALQAVLDYGRAIRDLALTGIFPGDLLVKNFGVTRNGRVVFYDYDELTEMTNCRFRTMPESELFEDEMSDTPWFPVGPDDVFPSEFESFLGLPDELKSAFAEHHRELFMAEWWQVAQRSVAAGEIVSIYPYPDSVRL